MKNMKFILSSVFVMAALSGCGKWNQDPLADKDGAFKDGQQNPTKDEKPNAEDPKDILLDSVDMYTFQEGVDRQFFKISGRILKAGYTAKIFIENMSDFPDAKFDDVNGEFKWNPAVGTVSGDKGQLEFRPLHVRVVAVSTAPGAADMSRGFTIDVRISKQLNAPLIYSVSNSYLSMREGDTQYITINVRDKDAGTDVKNAPIPLIVPLLGAGNLSSRVTVDRVLAAGNGEFVVTLLIDLSGQELTNSMDRFGFNIQMISRFQQASNLQAVTVDVVTSYSDLQSTWFDPIEVTAGVKNNGFQFMIFDPKGELYVNKPVFSGMPMGAVVNCNGVNVTRQLCSMTWTPPASLTPGDYSFTANVSAQNQNRQDTLVKQYSFPLKIRVVAPQPQLTSIKGGK